MTKFQIHIQATVTASYVQSYVCWYILCSESLQSLTLSELAFENYIKGWHVADSVLDFFG